MSQELLKRYWPLVLAVKEDHTRLKAEHGHSFLHAYSVAQYGEYIASNPVAGQLAWVAGLMHNTDRMPAMGDVRDALNIYLDHTVLLTAERGVVIGAVLNHHKRNEDSDDDVTIALKDADRLNNLGAAHMIRAGQFRPGIPVFDPRLPEGGDPKSNFRNPTSIIEDLRNVLEWETWFRLPRAKEIAALKLGFTRAAMMAIASEIRMLDLDKLPAELLD